MKKPAVSLLLLFAVASTSFASGGAETYDEYLAGLYRETVPTVLPAELAAGLGEATDNGDASGDLLILDVRSEAERAVSWIPGSLFIDYDEFTVETFGELLDSHGFSPAPMIVAYCAVGYRSERVGEQLTEVGYEEVSHLYGGIIEWVNRGYELVPGPEHPENLSRAVHGHSARWGKWVAGNHAVYDPAPR